MSAEKKLIKIKFTSRVSKAIHNDLVRFCSDRNKYIGDIIEDALLEYLHPFDVENHEKYSKMQMSRMIKMLIEVNNRLDISLICHEEAIRTFYRNIPELVFEDTQSKIVINARIIEGHDNFLKRVLDSAINNKPNILSSFNIKQESEKG